MPFPFVALTHFSTLNDCVRLSIIDLSDVAADGNIYTAAFPYCIVPGKRNESRYRFRLARRKAACYTITHLAVRCEEFKRR